MHGVATALVTIGGLVLSLACAVLIEELFLGGLFRLRQILAVFRLGFNCVDSGVGDLGRGRRSGDGRRQHGRGILVGDVGEHFLVERCRRFRFLAPRRLAALVDVLGVARRAARLLHVVFNHRDDRVIGHAPLARTVVVQNVAETQPSLLLHYLLPPDWS